MRDEPLPYPDPPLVDGRIGLRRWREADVECIRLAGTDPYIPKGTTVPAIFTPAEGLAYIQRQWSRLENGEGVSQAIVDVESDRAIGLMWVALRPQRHVGGLGYWIVPSERGQGVATAAVRLVIPGGPGRAEAPASGALGGARQRALSTGLHGAGFLLEGRLRNCLTIGDKHSDALVFSVITPLG